MNSPENMFTPVETLIMANNVAADIISHDEHGLDATGADLIFRNLAVITDRLSPADFDKLPKEVKDQVFAVAFMADDVAPMAEEDLVRRSHEDDASYEYRTGIWQRIHNLQTYVHTHSNDTTNELELAKLRYAVHGAGAAFAAVLEATQEVPAVAETVGYFGGNTRAAATRAKHVSRMAIRKASTEE